MGWRDPMPDGDPPVNDSERPWPVRVAVVDSGVHAAHPHVQGVAGGIAFDVAGRPHDDFVDRLGHGTAVTAVIREKAPDALVYAVRVFDRALTTSGRALVAACDWAIGSRVALINLSLGTQNPEHEGALRDVVARARAAGVLIVAAGDQDGIRWLPGSLPGVVSVVLDWTLPRETCRARIDERGEILVHATGYPRPIPGVPLERNLKGLSFAVANVTGLLAAWLSRIPGGDVHDAVRDGGLSPRSGPLGPESGARSRSLTAPHDGSEPGSTARETLITWRPPRRAGLAG